MHGDFSNQDESDPCGSFQLAPETHSIIYYPPNEFNWQQRRDAQGNIALTRLPVRYVRLQVQSHRLDGQPYRGQALIALLRPAVVLVHGINNSAQVWNHAPYNNGIGASLRDWQFTTLAFNHGIDDLEYSNTRRGAAFFKGNGPIEFAASRLSDTIQEAIHRYETAGFVGNRVDIVGHSYGGLIARWYIKTHSPLASPVIEGDVAPSPQLGWYIKSRPDTKPRPLYIFSPKVYQPTKASDCDPHVRKLITIATAWRGTPIANVVNELHSLPQSENTDLGLARLRFGPLPLVRFKGLKKLGDSWLSSIIPTKAPSLEVLAVESRWLRTLNAYPFRDNIEYEAIAGDNNAYIPTPLPRFVPNNHIDLFSTLHNVLGPQVLPVLEKESIIGRHTNLTDGIVPIWSAVIEPGSRLFPVPHDALLWDDEVKTYVAGSLSDCSLSGGANLNAQWRKPWSFTLSLPAEGKLPPDQRVWQFAPYVVDGNEKYPLMAPLDRAASYGQYDGFARINPTAIYPTAQKN